MEQRLSENNNFDFDIGYLVKSPCRDCTTRDNLPNCIQGCQILDQIQTVLADSIPSEASISPVDTYDVPSDVLDQIQLSPPDWNCFRVIQPGGRFKLTIERGFLNLELSKSRADLNSTPFQPIGRCMFKAWPETSGQANVCCRLFTEPLHI